MLFWTQIYVGEGTEGSRFKGWSNSDGERDKKHAKSPKPKETLEKHSASGKQIGQTSLQSVLRFVLN